MAKVRIAAATYRIRFKISAEGYTQHHIRLNVTEVVWSVSMCLCSVGDRISPPGGESFWGLYLVMPTIAHSRHSQHYSLADSSDTVDSCYLSLMIIIGA